MLALQGIRILDLSGGYPPALGTQILGDHGAEVINIEGRPGGGWQRADITSEEIRSIAAYNAVSRNKKSIILNLKTEEARQVFYKLAKTADVIIDPFRPGVNKRLGVDYKTIRKINPKIIYCSVSGYGQDGPYANLAGHDMNYIALAGALDLIGETNGPPVFPLNFLGDFAGAALHTALGVLIALMARTKTGRGQLIDISYTDSVIGLLTSFASDFFRTKKVPQRGTLVDLGSIATALYKTKDLKYITLACAEPWLWANLCRAVGKEEYVPYDLPRWRLKDPEDKGTFEEVANYFKQLFLTKTRDEWFDFLAPKDVPIGKVLAMDETFNDPHVRHRQMVIELEHPTEGKVKQVGIAIKLSDTPGQVRNLSPVTGEDTDTILKSLGFSEGEISELRRLGAVS
jgi:crotonobetainyl-CoA:carnitine CoA-transferase CaiB-like acyl-CoA transferase